jgi:DNA polymerase-1
MSKLLLIDGSNMMFKAYYGTAYGGPLMQRSDGLYTNALFGLSNILNKVLKEGYSHVVVAFDEGKENHRHLSYEAYKAGRAKMPEEFKMQLPYINELIHHLGLFSYQHKALEADDIIATLATRYYEDFETIEIMSSDKDLYQLLNDKVVLKIAQNKANDKAFFTSEDLHEKWGIKPHQVADLKGLMGDSSDNLPGVPGVGEKTALKLLQTYGDLETLFQNINEITGKLKDRLVEHQKDAFRWKEMARLIEDYPLEFGLDDFKYQGHKESLASFYQTFEFHSLLRKLDGPVKPVEAVKAVSFGAIKD